MPGAGAGAAEQFYSETEPEPEPEPTKNVTAPHPWLEAIWKLQGNFGGFWGPFVACGSFWRRESPSEREALGSAAPFETVPPSYEHERLLARNEPFTRHTGELL